MSIPQTPSPLSNILAAKTYNAAWFSGATKEAQITAAIAAAVTDGALYVYVPANMLPYTASNVTFNAAVRMIREGGDPSNFDVRAYGAAGDGIQDDTIAIQTAINAAYGATLKITFGNYLISVALSITKPLDIECGASATLAGVQYGVRIFTNTLGINLVNLNTGAVSLGNEDGGGSIRGLRLDGNSKAFIGLNITGANTTKWDFYHIDTLRCTHLGLYILANHSFAFYSSRWFLNGITSNLVTDGNIQLDGGNAVHFYSCNSETAFGCGLIVSGGYTNGWHGGAIEGNNYHGILGSGTAQHFTVEFTDFESNNVINAANIYDIDISTNAVAYWCLENLKMSGVLTADYVRNKGAQTRIKNVRGMVANKILWTITAADGLLEIDILNQLDPASVIDNTLGSGRVKVVDTNPNGMGVTTPAVPVSTVQQVNLTNVPVNIYITNPGTTTQWSVIDGGGRVQIIPAPVTYGFLCMLPPGHGIKITYSVVPTWKWYGI